jgi:hypothetical protein
MGTSTEVTPKLCAHERVEVKRFVCARLATTAHAECAWVLWMGERDRAVVRNAFIRSDTVNLRGPKGKWR